MATDGGETFLRQMEKLQSLVVRELHHQVGKTFLQIGQLVPTGHQVPVEVRDQLEVLDYL